MTQKIRGFVWTRSPKQLISQVRKSFTDSQGVIYEDFEYRREGVVDLYLVCEPLVGSREIFVRDNHNRLTWAEIIQYIALQKYPEAEKITLALDNLSAHQPSALYEIMSAAEARRILRRIEFVRTPKHGSVAEHCRNRTEFVITFGSGKASCHENRIRKTN